MSTQEKKAVFNIISSILIMGGYVFYTFYMHGDTNWPQIHELKFWARFTLIMIPVMIVLKIISYIIFHIILKSVDEDPDFMDEYDKQIEMRSDRAGHFIFIIGFMSSLIPIAYDQSVSVMFAILLSCGFAAGIVGDLLKIYYYRKGI